MSSGSTTMAIMSSSSPETSGTHTQPHQPQQPQHQENEEDATIKPNKKKKKKKKKISNNEPAPPSNNNDNHDNNATTKANPENSIKPTPVSSSFTKPAPSKPKTHKSKSSPFRIKAGCVATLRQDPAGNLVQRRHHSNNNNTDTLLPDPTAVQAWVNPQPGRDDGLALIGKRIRCFFSKELVKGKRRVLEGEVIRLVDYGKRKPAKAWKVDLLIDRKDLAHFTFLTRVDTDVNVATLANDKARRNHRNEMRIKGGEHKVVCKMRLQPPGSTVRATNCVQWAIQKRVPAKLFQSTTIKTTSNSVKANHGDGGDNERGNGAISPALSEPLDDGSEPRSTTTPQTTSAATPTTTTPQLQQSTATSATSTSNKTLKRPPPPTSADDSSRKRARASSPTPATTAQVRHVGDGNDPPDQQVANWRWLVSHYQDMMTDHNNNNDSNNNTTPTPASEISGLGLVGKVVKVDPPPANGSVKTLAMVTLQRLLLPEQTITGRLPHHGKYEVLELTDARKDERFVVPVEQLLVLGLSLQQPTQAQPQAASSAMSSSTTSLQDGKTQQQQQHIDEAEEDADPTAWPTDLHVKYSLKSNVYISNHPEEQPQQQPSSSTPSRLILPIGTRIRKYFDECVEFQTGHVTPAGWYEGQVSEFDPDLHLYKVRYSDGDEEEMYHREVVRGVQHFNNHTTELPTTEEEDGVVSLAHHDGEHMVGTAVCHRCRRTLPKAKLLFCASRECDWKGPEPQCVPVAWCTACVDTCHKMHTSVSNGSRETLPCCSGMCDCRDCWSRFATSWQSHYDSHVKEKHRKRQRDGSGNNNDNDGDSDDDNNKFFGSAEALSETCDVVDFVMDRTTFLDTSQLAAPAPNPMKRVKTKGRALRQFFRIHEKKTGKVGGESEALPDPLADEDFSVFKPTCARAFSYDKQRAMKRPLGYSVASLSNDVPRNLREVQKRRKKLLTEANPDEKTNASRAARAQQRQYLKGAANLGIGHDVLAGRESQLRFGRSTIHNWGVFADLGIAEGDLIVEYRGEIISNARAEQREKEYEQSKLPDYMFRIDKDTVCDATKLGNVARFINASCDPNCTAKIITVEGEKRIVVYAKKDIGEGDELTYDYKFAFDEDPTKRIPCLCRSPNCRGFLNWDKKYVSEQEIEERNAVTIGSKERSGVRARNETG